MITNTNICVFARARSPACLCDDIFCDGCGRDVMERMIKAGCAATSDFEWLSQLRFVFSREDGPFGMCSVRQTNCQLEYSYEYQVGACFACDIAVKRIKKSL